MKRPLFTTLCVIGGSLTLSGILFGLRGCNNYDSLNKSVYSNSRAVGFLKDKFENNKYNVKNIEEILVVNSKEITRYQNIDGNNTIDIIRTDKYIGRDCFKLENLLIRDNDYNQNKIAFKNADDLLQKERTKKSKEQYN